MKQVMSNYTKQDHEVWSLLFDRQQNNLSEKGSKEYLVALNKMQDVLHKNSVPDFEKVNQWFKTSTQWQIEVVKGLIPVDDFFELLSQKKFCSSTWLRSIENLDYLEEPDMFHDVFGHVPLLSNEVFSEFVFKFGKIGHQYRHNQEVVLQLQRLYWFTIEFGLIKEQDTKVYGAGIISSFGETNKIFENDCNIMPFDIEVVLEKTFRTDVMQNDYFMVDSLEELFNSLSIVEQKLSKQCSGKKIISA
jgi:phenylalanine-4-hydroxylase